MSTAEQAKAVMTALTSHPAQHNDQEAPSASLPISLEYPDWSLVQKALEQYAANQMTGAQQAGTRADLTMFETLTVSARNIYRVRDSVRTQVDNEYGKL